MAGNREDWLIPLDGRSYTETVMIPRNIISRARDDIIFPGFVRQHFVQEQCNSTDWAIVYANGITYNAPWQSAKC